MAQKEYGGNPSHIKLRDSDRVLEDNEQDIRGWPVEDSAGNRVGTVEDLLLNTDTELVDAIAFEDGAERPLDGVEVGNGTVYLLGAARPPSEATEAGELRVQRSEEELVAGTREREAGAFRVRKRVETDRERIAVPKRREEVRVDRVPVERREASGAEIDEDEVVMPVTEEEVVVGKRPVVKEEVRVRTDVVEEQEVVEEDVRKEEVEVIDETESGRGQ
jgi:uncharacterized protein (TIGR02271 family)